MPSEKLEGDVEKVATKLASEIYSDLAKPAIKEVGTAVGRTTKALLSPLRSLLWGWERIENLVEEGLNRRLENVPEDRLKTPDPEIAVPLIQALTYTAQNETLREMYLNLLANSMNSSQDKIVHPSFVALIKQMNSLDARVFDKLAENRGRHFPINPRVHIKNSNQYLIDATPEWFVGWVIAGFDMFDISASIIRLGKFGLIELMYDRTAGDTDDSLKSHPDLLSALARCEKAKPEFVFEIQATNSVIYVNEYGKQFQTACK